MGPRLTTPAPAPITATEATTIYRQAEYPALFNIVLDYNQDGSGLTWPTTFFIMFITIAIVALAVFTYKRLRRCHQKRKLKEAEEIQDYQVVWARVGHWPWWPGVVSSRTRRRGKTLQREVVFFGEDNRGLNTESYLVSGARIFLTLISWCSGREEHQTIPWEG